MNIVLANYDYYQHMTDEGLQLQNGLCSAGWRLCGDGYDGETHVPTLLRHYKPQAVFVQDKRDWDPDSGCCTGGNHLKFKHLQALKTVEGPVAVVVKDAGPDGSAYHEQFCTETGAKAVVLYYNPISCFRYCPWLSRYHLIRTYHTVNPQHVPEFVPANERSPAVGSGAVMGDVYPIRLRVMPRASDFGLVWLQHPGYGNRGCHTPRYLQFISRFKVHLATASSYGFALRKIIESVACGCTPITDLPAYDTLPEIDRALVRVKPTISDQDLQGVIRQAVEDWDEDGRRKWADKALSYYHYEEMGQRLSADILRV